MGGSLKIKFEMGEHRQYGDFLKEHFGCKVQKISVNAGFSCPNRDGTKGRGGCTYCNNTSFSPEYCNHPVSITEQLEQGKQFFSRKYKDMRYLAYFQSYTNTYGDTKHLMNLYREALAVEDVVGLVIATRPDCVDDELLASLAEVNHPGNVMIEFGAESAHDRTLKLVNRGHTWADVVDAVKRTVAHGIDCGLHFIMGLPGETREDMLATVRAINELPVTTVKFHQLQVLKGTCLARQIEEGELDVIRWTAQEYAGFCAKILNLLRPDIVVERMVSQSPDELLLFPRWGLKNYQFMNLLNNFHG